MPVLLTDDLPFPEPQYADADGLLAVGGTLSVDRIKEAYARGAFPWYDEGSPVLWWAPDPRMVLFPDDLHISHSMKPLLRKKSFTVTADTCFSKVIRNCADLPRNEQQGTWITDDIIETYCALHRQGQAHSIEVWTDGQLVGGLYGVAMGTVFFGESMFSRVSNASKYGFIKLVRWMKEMGYRLIDCQIFTNHLASLGASEIPAEDFYTILAKYVSEPGIPGPWTSCFNDFPVSGGSR